MDPIFFSSKEEFREWLAKNYDKEKEVLVGYYKVGSGKPSMSWSESVDQALCYGWIDGVRKSMDLERYFIRFTPRRPNSIWSTVNIKKVGDLTKAGLMQPPGIAVYNLRQEKKSQIYSYESQPSEFTEELLSKFKGNSKAWETFLTFPKSYQKAAAHWVSSAKQESTRWSRLETLIKDSEEGRRVKPLSYVKKD